MIRHDANIEPAVDQLGSLQGYVIICHPCKSAHPRVFGLDQINLANRACFQHNLTGIDFTTAIAQLTRERN